MPRSIRKLLFERSIGNLPGMAMPAAALLFLSPETAAWYFRLSLLIQLSMQLNYVYGVEYQLARFSESESELGRQIVFRCGLPVFLITILHFVYPAELSLVDLGVLVLYVCSCEMYSVVRIYMSVGGKQSGLTVGAFILASSPFVVAKFLGEVHCLLLAQAASFVVAIWLTEVRWRELWCLPTFCWMRGFFSRANIVAPSVWIATRGDRVIGPYMGFYPADGYMLSGAIADTIFGTLRQVQLIAGGSYYVTAFAVGFLVWLSAVAVLFFTKNVMWDQLFLLPVIFQAAAALMVVAFLRGKRYDN